MTDVNSKVESQSNSSLVDPNFEGLWSVAWIGRSNSALHKLWGFCCSFLVLGSWFFGGTSPLWLSALLYLRYYTTVVVILPAMAYPFVFEVKGWPWGVRSLILAGAHWYEGGASLSYEMPPEGFQNDCSEEASKQTPTLMGYHPHGIFSLGFIYCAGIRYFAVMNETDKDLREYYGGQRLNDARDVFGPLKMHIGLAADSMSYFPFWRHFVVGWTQSTAPSGKGHFFKLMETGTPFGLVPGGFYEASFTRHGKEQIYIKKVKGFIKYALRFGYRVLPVYVFGECHTYYNLMNFTGFGRLKKWLNARGIATVIPFGKWFCPILPLNNGVGIHAICSYGKRLPKIPEPTQAEIDEWHAWYVAEIRALFDRNKHRFGMDDKQLHVW